MLLNIKKRIVLKDMLLHIVEIYINNSCAISSKLQQL